MCTALYEDLTRNLATNTTRQCGTPSPASLGLVLRKHSLTDDNSAIFRSRSLMPPLSVCLSVCLPLTRCLGQTPPRCAPTVSRVSTSKTSSGTSPHQVLCLASACCTLLSIQGAVAATTPHPSHSRLSLGGGVLRYLTEEEQFRKMRR